MTDEYAGYGVANFFKMDPIEIPVIIFVWPAEKATSEYDAFFLVKECNISSLDRISGRCCEDFLDISDTSKNDFILFT